MLHATAHTTQDTIRHQTLHVCQHGRNSCCLRRALGQRLQAVSTFCCTPLHTQPNAQQSALQQSSSPLPAWPPLLLPQASPWSEAQQQARARARGSMRHHRPCTHMYLHTGRESQHMAAADQRRESEGFTMQLQRQPCSLQSPCRQHTKGHNVSTRQLLNNGGTAKDQQCSCSGARGCTRHHRPCRHTYIHTQGGNVSTRNTCLKQGLTMLCSCSAAPAGIRHTQGGNVIT
jgi:hypothetical protein